MPGDLVKNKRLLFLVPTTGFGGAELHTLTLAKHFVALGNTCTIAFPFCDGTRRLHQDCLTHGIGALNMPIAPVAAATPEESVAEQSRRLRAHLDPNAYDAVVVAVPSPISGAGLIDAIATTSLPGIAIFHLVADTLVIPQQIRLKILRALRPNFRLVGVADFSCDMLCNALGVDRADGFVHLIHNGVSITPGDEPFDLRGLIANPQARTVITVGRVHPQKGGIYLVNAIPQVLKAVPDARFIWFGDGPDLDKLRRQAAHLGVSYAIYFAGHTDRPVDAIRAADVVALPTLYEAGPSLALMEAMHCGAAIVTTDASYQGRVLIDGMHASIVPRTMSDPLATAIVKLLTDDDLAASYRENAKALAQNFTERRMLEGYTDCLETLLHEPVALGLEPKPAAPTSWVTLAEESQGYALYLSPQVPPTTPGQGMGSRLTNRDLLAPVGERLAGAEKLAFAFAFGGEVETLADGCDLAHHGSAAMSLARVILDVLSTDPGLDVGRVLLIYRRLITAVEQVDPDTDCDDVVAGILAFETCFGIDPRISAISLLNAVRDPAARAEVLQNLARRIASDVPEAGDSGTERDAALSALLDRLGLSQSDRALFRAYYNRTLNRDFEAEKYFLVHAALSGRAAKRAEATPPQLLFFAEHFNYPPVNGGDRRMISLMKGYQALGFNVHFAGLQTPSLRAQKRRQVHAMRDDLGIEAHYIPMSQILEDVFRAAHRELQAGHNAIGGFFDLGLLTQLRTLAVSIAPSVFHVNYCYFGWTAAAVEGLNCHRVIDTHDLISRRINLNRELLRLFGGKRPQRTADVPGFVHQPEALLGRRYSMLSEELTEIEQFDTVLMISPGEGRQLAPMIKRDSVRPLEMFQPYAPAPRIVPCVEYGARNHVRALFSGGNNIYNFAAAAAIQNHILPSIDAQLGAAEDFAVRVAGDVCQTMHAHHRLELLGRIPNVETAYLNVDFALCPIPAGTGQNVKIVEALSKGIPVVTYTGIGQSANVVSGVNGILAQDLDAMRRAIVTLVRDPSYREALRESTRAWARERFTQTTFVEALKNTMVTTGYQFPDSREN